jgi:hypothetical protein
MARLNLAEANPHLNQNMVCDAVSSVPALLLALGVESGCKLRLFIPVGKKKEEFKSMSH